MTDESVQLESRVRLLPGTQERQSGGERWLDHRCLHHQDRHRSASFQPESGVYFCRVCGRLRLNEVLIGVPSPQDQDQQQPSLGDKPRRARATRPRKTSRTAGSSNPALPAVRYLYRFPDGRPSHLKIRTQLAEGGKEFSTAFPDGRPGRPRYYHPFYGDDLVDEGDVLLVVEGEKAVDLVQIHGESWQGKPIRAITAGSADDLRRHAETLAARIMQLRPSLVFLWPDNDDPGRQAMDSVVFQLRRADVDHRLVDPSLLELPPKADVVEWPGTLAEVVDRFLGDVQSQDAVELALGELVCPGPASFIMPLSYRPLSITTEHVTAAWWHFFERLPTMSESRTMLARLQLKAVQEPVRVEYRRVAFGNSFYWRGVNRDPSIRVTADGVDEAEPPDTILMVPEEQPQISPEVDVSGDFDDFQGLTREFGLDLTTTRFLQGFLMCSLLGLQAPVLYLRGGHGSGKTTLARLLTGILDPLIPEIDADKEMQRDPRELLRALQTTPVALVDNVTRLSDPVQNVLCKLVTGYTSPVRFLNTEIVEMVHLKRAVILTTINWETHRQDLLSRMVAATPKLKIQGRWLSDQDALSRFGGRVPKIRGWLFKQCSEFYRRAHYFHGQMLPFRIGDLGLVFAALGLDVNALAMHHVVQRVDIGARDDERLQAFVQLWRDIHWQAPISYGVRELVRKLQDAGVESHISVYDNTFRRWIAEQASTFRQLGFEVVYDRARGYVISAAPEPEDEDDSE